MEPRIQYAKTSDGVNIAYWTLGEGLGPPLLIMPSVFSNIEAEWRTPELHDAYVSLARTREVVRYDYRGAGMSDRDVTDFSLDRHVMDLEAVADSAGLRGFALLGTLIAGPVAISYAVAHPERISHLILSSSWARAGDYYASPQAKTLVSLRGQDWETYTHAIGHAFTGWSGEQGNLIARLMRESVSPETLVAMASSAAQYDATDLLPKVSVPTLVVHPRDFSLVDMRLARALASAIPEARLVIINGSFPFFFGEAGEQLREVVRDFLGEQDEDPVPSHGPSGTAIILFADIADSTALTERLGDAAFREKARELGTSLRTLIRECGGTPVEGPTLGDGVLAVFTSAREAIEAAVRCRDEGSRVELPLHLGLHAGDVTREKDPDGRDNVYGGAVNIAARISGLSAPGEALVSHTVRDLARTSAGVTFEDRGEQSLKGVGEAVRVWAVREAE